MIHAHRLLAVGFDAAEFQPLSAGFDPSWDVDCLPSGSGALDLLRLCRVDLVVIRYPLPGIAVETFLQALRSHQAESHSTSLVLVTERANASAACRYIGSGVNRVLSLERAPELLSPTVHALLRIAPRKPVRFGARLEMPRLGSFLGVVRNSSRTGLLIETGQKPPRGT
ncbi:MAG: hypothetical protein AAGF23_18270, partial [Acidobacteriota bacterium]